MKKFVFLWAALVILAFQVGPLTAAQGEMVGRLSMVEGQVDLLKGGQLPAIPVKVNDDVQQGDVLRTKSLSKAQITFNDNSTLMISPESRVAIEEYMFDPASKKRNAVIQLFQGLAHVVVQKVFQAGEPNFVVKTHTAIMGIRGTDFGIRLSPNSSTILDFEGVIQVGNIFAEVGQLFMRAFKVAYGWGVNPEKWVLLHTMEGTTVDQGMIPRIPFIINESIRDEFDKEMHTHHRISRQGTSSSGIGNSLATTSEATGTGSSKLTGQGNSPLGSVSPNNVTILNMPLKPQTVTQPPAHSGNR